MTAAYRARKAKAMPKCLSIEHKKEIQDMYTLAKTIEYTTGIKMEIDHIVLLKSKNGYYGLHVPWNLRVVTRSENRHKSNNFDFTEEY